MSTNNYLMFFAMTGFIVSCHEPSHQETSSTSVEIEDNSSELQDRVIEVEGESFYIQTSNYIMVDSDSTKDTFNLVSTDLKIDSKRFFEISIKHKEGSDGFTPQRYLFKRGRTSERALYLDNSTGSLLEYHSNGGYLELEKDNEYIKGVFEIKLKLLDSDDEITLSGTFKTYMDFRCVEVGSDSVVREVDVDNNQYCKEQRTLF